MGAQPRHTPGRSSFSPFGNDSFVSESNRLQQASFERLDERNDVSGGGRYSNNMFDGHIPVTLYNSNDIAFGLSIDDGRPDVAESR
jgi:hypothetical protein